jgi:hypothetical protein
MTNGLSQTQGISFQEDRAPHPDPLRMTPAVIVYCERPLSVMLNRMTSITWERPESIAWQFHECGLRHHAKDIAFVQITSFIVCTPLQR